MKSVYSSVDESIPVLIDIVFLLFLQCTLIDSFSWVQWINIRFCSTTFQALQTNKSNQRSSYTKILSCKIGLELEYLLIFHFQRVNGSQRLKPNQLIPKWINYIFNQYFQVFLHETKLLSAHNLPVMSTIQIESWYAPCEYIQKVLRL